jgi:hypothetical protein
LGPRLQLGLILIRVLGHSSAPAFRDGRRVAFGFEGPTASNAAKLCAVNDGAVATLERPRLPVFYLCREKECGVPLYFLKVVETNDPNPPNDHEPQEFPNLEAACGEAVLAFREMASEEMYSGISFCVERIDITDETRQGARQRFR